MSKPMADVRSFSHLQSSLPMQPSEKSGELWGRISRRLRAELGEEVFTSWFGRLELDGIADGAAQLSVPPKFLKSWIQSHYQERMPPRSESHRLHPTRG